MNFSVVWDKSITVSKWSTFWDNGFFVKFGVCLHLFTFVYTCLLLLIRQVTSFLDVLIFFMSRDVFSLWLIYRSFKLLTILSVPGTLVVLYPLSCSTRDPRSLLCHTWLLALTGYEPRASLIWVRKFSFPPRITSFGPLRLSASLCTYSSLSLLF